jgi:hypothetical protein
MIRSREDVMKTTFKALSKRRSPGSVIDGGVNKVTAISSRFFTRRFAIKLAARVMNPNKKS